MADRSAGTARIVTDADRAAWLAWARERATEAFDRGREALEAGDLPLARRWLERARRLAETDQSIAFALASLYLRLGEVTRAAPIFADIAERHDTREAWAGLAASARALGDLPRAVAAIGAALARHAPDTTLATLAGCIATEAGLPGWCGVSGDGVLLTGSEPASLSVMLDDAPARLQRAGGAVRLPRAWRVAQTLSVRLDGVALLGCPVQLGALRRAEGFVAAEQGVLSGWAWHPGDPERDPELTIVPVGGGAKLRVTATDLSVAAPGERPLARARGFHVPATALPEGPVHVLGADGRDLLGSPLDPGLERRAAVSIATAIAAANAASVPPGAARAGLAAASRAVPLWADIAVSPTAGGARAEATDVVIPVYRGLQRTLDCLATVLETVPASSRVIVVDDASPEPILAEALDGLAQEGRILLLRHPRNRGFPAAANTGMRAAAGRDVVLLNSDTLVAPGWLEGLRAAAHAANDIGTATPFSNDATILSYPEIGKLNPMPDLAETRRLAALAARVHPGLVLDIPTAHGFCMYIRRDCLDAVGLLREDVFAQGYGEENDFSLRARHLGWRHVAVPGVYVAHVGGESFGLARQHLIRRNLALLNRLHPGYDALIAAHIAADPLAPARRALDAARWREAARPDGAVLLITHASGGGVERVLRERCAAHRAAGLRPIVLRPKEGECVLGDGVEGGYPNLRFRLPEELDAAAALLRADKPVHAELHHLLGHDHAVLDLVRRLDIPYDAYVHDYAWFCPRIALVGPERRYCGEPDPRDCDICVQDAGSNLEEEIGVGALLARSVRDLAAARQVIAPSADAATRIARHFPRIRPTVLPWEDDGVPPPLVAGEPGHPALRVCIIGGIGVEKGYDILLACARDAERRRLRLEFVVVGHTTDDTRLMQAGPVFVTGEYHDDDVDVLIRAQRADIAFLPSIWPETWCYTLGHAWRAGLRVAAFDIGAPAERIRRTGRGWLLPLGLSAPAVNNALLALRRVVVDAGRPHHQDTFSPADLSAVPAVQP